MQDDLQAMAGGIDDGVSVHTGFPNPGIESRNRSRPLALDLNSLLIKRPSSTYIFRISGHSHSDQGIHDGDLALIDRAQTPRTSDLVLAWQGSGFIICRYSRLSNGEEPVGVVTSLIRRLSL